MIAKAGVYFIESLRLLIRLEESGGDDFNYGP